MRWLCFYTNLLWRYNSKASSSKELVRVSPLKVKGTRTFGQQRVRFSKMATCLNVSRSRSASILRSPSASHCPKSGTKSNSRVSDVFQSKVILKGKTSIMRTIFGNGFILQIRSFSGTVGFVPKVSNEVISGKDYCGRCLRLGSIAAAASLMKSGSGILKCLALLFNRLPTLPPRRLGNYMPDF